MALCRILEIVAGVAAAAFVAVLVWEDFFSTADQRERWDRSARLRSGYYLTALVVLASVIVLGIRDC